MVYGHVWRSAVWHSKDGKVFVVAYPRASWDSVTISPCLVLLSRYLRPKIILFFLFL